MVSISPFLCSFAHYPSSLQVKGFLRTRTSKSNLFPGVCVQHTTKKCVYIWDSIYISGMTERSFLLLKNLKHDSNNLYCLMACMSQFTTEKVQVQSVSFPPLFYTPTAFSLQWIISSTFHSTTHSLEKEIQSTAKHPFPLIISNYSIPDRWICHPV